MFWRRLIGPCAALCFGWALSGCTGLLTAEGPNPKPECGTTRAAAGTPFSYADVQQVFDNHCASGGCHAGSNPTGGLDLSAGASFANLVGVASSERPDQLRIDPGHPERSYLLAKIDPSSTCIQGAHMPAGASPMGEDVIDGLAAWVLSGAQGPDGTGADAGAGDGPPGPDAAVPDTTPPTFMGAQSATARGENGATVTWTAARDNVSPASAIRYHVFVATSPAGENFAMAALIVTGTTSAMVTNLSAGKTYYFVVRAEDQAGNIETNKIEVSTRTSDLTPPSFEGLISAMPGGPGAVTLTWTAASDNVDLAAAIKYRVYAATSAGGENFAAPTVTTPPGATSATVTGLLDATTYFFVVRAVDSAGNEDANPVERSVTTADTTPPNFGGATSATPAPNSITLGWAAANDRVTPGAQIVYLVYQATTPGGESFASPTYTTAPGVTSFAVGGLLESTTYYFVVRARDQAGNIDPNRIEVSATTPAAADITPPTFAGAMSASATTATSITLTWPAAQDNLTPSAQIVYLVYQATAAGGENFGTPTFTTAPGVTSFVVTGLAPQTTRLYVVRARDQAGNIDANRIEVSATTPADTTPPTFAGADTATAQSQSSISLTWPAASDDVTPAAQVVYLVYQSSTAGGENFATPSFTATGVTTFLVGGLAPSTRYFFVVRARDQAGNLNTNTHEVSAVTGTDISPPDFTGASSATAETDQSIQVTWPVATDNATPSAQIVYLIYQATTSGGENFGTPSFTVTGMTSITSTGLLPSRSYFFVVRARDAAGNINTNTHEVTAVTLADRTPPTFGGATSATARSASTIDLGWAAAMDDVSPSQQITYLVYRATTSGGQNFGSPTYTTGAGVTTFTASNLAASTTYFFVVRARDQAGNIDGNTVQVSATTPAAPPPPPISFSSQVQPIFNGNCTSCHSGGGAPAGLNLSSGSAYGNLVNVDSSECSPTKRVLPNMPTMSYLVFKLQGSGACFTGTQMPQGSGPLSAAQQNTISTWISQGAPNN